MTTTPQQIVDRVVKEVIPFSKRFGLPYVGEIASANFMATILHPKTESHAMTMLQSSCVCGNCLNKGEKLRSRAYEVLGHRSTFMLDELLEEQSELFKEEVFQLLRDCATNDIELGKLMINFLLDVGKKIESLHKGSRNGAFIFSFLGMFLCQCHPTKYNNPKDPQIVQLKLLKLIDKEAFHESEQHFKAEFAKLKQNFLARGGAFGYAIDEAIDDCMRQCIASKESSTSVGSVNRSALTKILEALLIDRNKD